MFTGDRPNQHIQNGYKKMNYIIITAPVLTNKLPLNKQTPFLKTNYR